MAKQFSTLNDDHMGFIRAQHIFFCGSAAATGRVNVSPKGMDSLRVLAPDRIVWRNLTGSGNETAGHLRLDPRMTLMWCSFAARPLILRVYGLAREIRPDDAGWPELDAHFPPDKGARQIFDLALDLVQTSCGYAVPLMENPRERDVLAKWAETKSEAEIRRYWDARNAVTIDGFPTGFGS